GMQVGQATIPGKNTSVRVTFANEYSAPPIVMLTLASDSSLMRYFVSNVTEFGFTLNLYPSQYQDTLFNWQAYPASGVQSSETVSQPILEDLPEYEVPAVIPPQDDFLPIVPDKEDNTLNLNGAEDVLYNDGLSIVEVGDSLGEDINSDEDVSDDVPVEEPVAEVVEEIVEEPVVPEAPADVPTAPEESEVPADVPTEILE
ncbi:MAG TPA: H-type lectin domain-containing protein, partial [bacterium]|nr:H-type lectin domain-containing protein [bacterium]